jgi:hypothetical protein
MAFRTGQEPCPYKRKYTNKKGGLFGPPFLLSKGLEFKERSAFGADIFFFTLLFPVLSRQLRSVLSLPCTDRFTLVQGLSKDFGRGRLITAPFHWENSCYIKEQGKVLSA